MAHIYNSFIQSGTIKKYFTHLHSLISYGHVKLNTVVISHYPPYCHAGIIFQITATRIQVQLTLCLLTDRRKNSSMFCLANQVIRRAIITTVLPAKYQSLQTITKLVHKIAVFKINCIKSVEVHLQEWEKWLLVPNSIYVRML
jgi:hypothetical protein